MLPHPARPLLEVADILRAHGEAYRTRHPVSREQATVMRRLAACRTAALGGHMEVCRRTLPTDMLVLESNAPAVGTVNSVKSPVEVILPILLAFDSTK